jgi:polar amino acid transport system permease protein
MKRRTRAKLLRAVLYTVVVLAVLAFALFADWPELKRNFLNLDIAKSEWPQVVTVAAKNTIIYTTVGFLGGLAIALVIALMRISPVAALRGFGVFYVETFRGLPALLTIYFVAYVLPIALGVNLGSVLVKGGIALAVVAGAYMAETIRAGLESVPRGQMEAARSLGMGAGWATTSIVLPQAIRTIIPPLTNEYVLLLKDSSLLFIAGFSVDQYEIFQFTRSVANTTGNATPYIVAGLVYLAITLPLTRVVAYLERRTKRAR